MDSRLEEIRLEEARRRPMTTAQMVRFYWGVKDHRPSQKDRFIAALGEALIALGQRVKPEKTVQTIKPAYRGKKVDTTIS
jgi:hypothetical protein